MKRTFSVYFLVFLFGFFSATTIYFHIESEYESQLFNAIVQNLNEDPIVRTRKDTFLIRSMRMANELVNSRMLIFGGQAISGLKANYIHAATVDLMTGNGACGSASVVLARILKANNFKVRIAQMKVGNVWGGHIVTEVKKDANWIVLDPLLNVVFKNGNGTLASFNDVKNNWEYYSKQLPSQYPLEYNYQNVRYTNWSRLGIFEKPIIFIGKLICGQGFIDGFCARSYMLRIYHRLYLVSLLFTIFTAILTGLSSTD